tara:strand:- start:18997 stop:20661 length:1665 start_codon:yes stop_codon:yes gene_type:complete
MIDWLTGFRKLDELYRVHRFENLEATAFAERLLRVLDIRLHNTDGLLASVPATGPCLLVANHPLGAIEGVALAWILSRRRADVKILANRRLQVFSELSSWFIFTEPLKRGAQGNLSSLRACHQHLSQGGLLIVFPAGRVATRRSHSEELQDYPWHRSIKSLLKIAGLVTLPVFIEGRNSPLFYRLGRLHPQLRMMTLMREMLRAEGKALGFFPGKPMVDIPADVRGSDTSISGQIASLRLLTCLQNPELKREEPLQDTGTPDPLAPAVAKNVLAAEVAALPAAQCLDSTGLIHVYYSSMQQTPAIVSEIQRLRESVFRDLDEGSGQSSDGDEFDKTYVHVFLYNNQTQGIIGACRLGRTDMLLQTGGESSLYLGQMFAFSPDFINMNRPCLEMGRSFITPEFQRSYQALLLLFKGIGGFIRQFPHYQTLYGTVSISRQYSMLSTLLIREALVQSTQQVVARKELAVPVPSEMTDYLKNGLPSISQLDWLVRQLEPDGKGLPVLLRHYAKMGARFYTMGVDLNFAGTPGLLLSVDIAGLSKRTLKQFHAIHQAQN